MLLTILVCSWTLFIPFVLLVPRLHLFEVLNAILVGTCVSVAIIYAKPTWKAVKLPPHNVTGADSYIVTRFIGCVSLALIFAGQWVWRAFDRPEWAISSTVVAFSRWALASALLLALATTFTDNGQITPIGYRDAGILALIATSVATALIFFGWG